MVIPFGATLTTRPLHDKRETAASMASMVEKYADDLGEAADLPLSVFYRRVANLPYKVDPRGLELVARPKYALQLAGLRGIDCKKKATIIASFLKLNGIPWRFVGSSSQKKTLFGRPRIHHVFTQGHFCDIATGCRWRNVDATYPRYRLFEPKPDVTRAVVFGKGRNV